MIPLEKINPYIRFAKVLSFYYRQTTNSVCYDCRLFYLQNGNGIIRINNTEYPITNNTVIYMPPATRYHFSFENYDNITMLVFNFDLTSKHSNLTESFGTVSEEDYQENTLITYEIPMEFEKPIILSKALHLLKPLHQCINDFFNKEPFYNLTISAKFKLALISLLKESPEFGCNNLVLQVYEYIHIKCDLSSVTPKEIAEHFHYHPYYLSHVLKKNIGKTLQQYLTYYRIKIAKNYLTTTNTEIGLISDLVGFNSTAYFIKVFRESTGETPMHYRNNHTVF